MKITDFLSETNGNGSNVRLAVLLVVLTVLGNWTGANVINAQIALNSGAPMSLVPLNYTEVGAIIGMAGVKVWQKGKETTPTDGNA